MADKITLNNLVVKVATHMHENMQYMGNFCPVCGVDIMETTETTEHVCSACRNLVKDTDQFCNSCGSPLTTSSLVEHHVAGEKLDDTQFAKVKKMKFKEVLTEIDSIRKTKKEKI
jgi:hypothetical protein